MKEYENFKTADIVAEALIDWDVDVVFGLPGDGINGFIEALRQRQNKIKFVLVRHEESAAFMACAYAKYTKKLGVCVATSGPGAIHLLNGLYDAKLDSAPVLAITGTTYSDLMGSNYQQDVNLLQLFSDVTVYNNMINSPEHAEMAVDIACRNALGRRGVSHLTIPIDVQEQKLKDKYSPHKVKGHTSDIFNHDVIPSPELLSRAANILNEGKKIVILVGQGALDAGDEVATLCERLNAPVVKALLGKAVISDYSPYSLGGIGMLGTSPASDAMNEADTILMIGTSFPYIDYLPNPGQARGIQIDIIPERIGLRYPVDIGLVGDSKQTLNSLIPMLNKRQKKDNEFLASKQKAMKKWESLLKEQGSRTDKPIKPQVIATAVSNELDDDAIISVDSGTNTIWAARYIFVHDKMKFSLSGISCNNGMRFAVCNSSQNCVSRQTIGGFCWGWRLLLC